MKIKSYRQRKASSITYNLSSMVSMIETIGICLLVLITTGYTTNAFTTIVQPGGSNNNNRNTFYQQRHYMTTTTTTTDGFTTISNDKYDIVKVDLDNNRDYPIYIGAGYQDEEGM